MHTHSIPLMFHSNSIQYCTYTHFILCRLLSFSSLFLYDFIKCLESILFFLYSLYAYVTNSITKIRTFFFSWMRKHQKKKISFKLPLHQFLLSWNMSVWPIRRRKKKIHRQRLKGMIVIDELCLFPNCNTKYGLKKKTMTIYRIYNWNCSYRHVTHMDRISC